MNKTLFQSIFFLFLVLHCFELKARTVFSTSESCGRTERDQNSMNWCLARNSSSKILMIYFHGFGQTEKRLIGDFNYPQLDAIGKQEFPNYIGISFGRFAVLNNSTAAAFFAEKIDEIVKSYFAESGIQKTVVLGDSLGGLNALQLLFWGRLTIKKMVLICPAIAIANPFDNQGWQADPDTRQSSSIFRSSYRALLRASYKDSSEFSKNSAIENLLYSDKIFNSSIEESHIVTAGKDSYGFQEAHQVTCQKMNSKGMNCSRKVEISASHCKVSSAHLSKTILD